MVSKINYPLNKLDNYFLNHNRISEDLEYEVFDIYAKDLITVNRIDLVVKYYYIKCREKNQNLDFAKELYEKHIEAFTDSTFKEEGNSSKNSIEKYFEVFDNLIDIFKNNEYDSNISIIPLGKNYELLDGSHRTACAAYFNNKIKVIRFSNLSVDYGFKYFKIRLLDEFYLNFIAQEFVALKDNMYTLLVSPKIKLKRKIKTIDIILKKNQCKVIYSRKSKFRWKEIRKIISQIYNDEYKTGNNKKIFKADLYYNVDECVEIYIIDCPSLEILTKVIDEIREIEKYYLYISDKQKENIEILNFILGKSKNNFMQSERIKYYARKIRYIYRVTINKLKYILGKSV